MKRRNRKGRVRLRCDRCKQRVKGRDGDHDSAYSANGITWEGIAVVAWCRYCGHEFASDQ